MKKIKNFLMLFLLGIILAKSTEMIAFANTTVPHDIKTFIHEGKYYIVKTYILTEGETEDDIKGKSFEENGVVYNQISVESTPLKEIEKKEAEEKETVIVSSKDSAQAMSKLPVQKEYTDTDGFTGILLPEADSIVFEASNYVTKRYTKNDSKYYYNLPSMDVGNISKTIISEGVTLNLTDVQWINSNNSESGDTTVGNTYTAQAFYSGTYTKEIPTGYQATVTYKGEIQREVEKQWECKVTFTGEKIEVPQELHQETKEHTAFSKGVVVAAIACISSMIMILVYFVIKKYTARNKED